jgi:hypothetical protein
VKTMDLKRKPALLNLYRIKIAMCRKVITIAYGCLAGNVRTIENINTVKGMKLYKTIKTLSSTRLDKIVKRKMF